MIQLRFSTYNSDLTVQSPNNWYFSRDGIGLSDYVSLGTNITTALDGTISTYAIDLIGYPTDEEFEPTTKFALDIYEDYKYVKTIYMVLQDDVVEKPIMSDDTYFIHHLSLADPAIIAQQRSCDNMAITYKLKDVSLTSAETVDTTSTVEEKGNYEQNDIDNDISYFVENERLQGYIPNRFGYQTYTSSGLNVERTLVAYKYVWRQPTFTFDSDNNPIVSYSTNIALKNLMQNYVNASSITFDVPMILCQIGQQNSTSYTSVGFLPTEVKITRFYNSSDIYEYYDNENDSWETDETWNTAYPSETLSDASFTSLSNQGGLSIPLENIHWIDNASNTNAIRNYSSTSYYVDALTRTNIVGKQVFNTNETIDTRTNLPMNRRIIIPTDAGYTYYIDVRLKRYTSSLQFFYNLVKYTFPNGSIENYTYTGTINVNQPLNISVKDINVYSQNTKSQIFTKSADITNCYYLLKKAVFSTYFANYNGTTPMDMDTPIDVDSDTRYMLENTKIIESMYQQKNLWEIITEIGHYVHAKPYLTFGNKYDSNGNYKGQLLLKFIKYGSSDLIDNKGTRNTIFNSRFVEEYISSLDCYVDNLLQLDSTITEVVVPSSESEDYLVYNDNAILKTKYPILEIVKLEVLRPTSSAYTNNSWVDITNYVYEYNIWKCLGIDTSVVPNRSIAIYYHLGEKKVEGFQYLIPSLHGTQQYPIKKIIGEVYSMSSADMASIVVNDYAFRITYRAKDSVRTRVVRPDIRKYLKNNLYDYMPVHSQFRNQTDKIVDSEKYGDNIYGELIRTGNRVVEESRWTTSINDINEIGDLVKLDDDNLYYVSKVSTIIYADHYESTLEYTKDFNRLSQIIGIPSEPRFYEISEQSQIRREININQPITFATDLDKIDFDTTQNIFTPLKTYNMLNYLLKSQTNNRYNRVKITYKGVDKNYDTDSNDFETTVYADMLWSIQNTTLTFEFDMADNFMVDNVYGDAGFTYPNGFWSFIDFCYKGSANTQAYKTLEPVRYTDVYGRADTCYMTLGWNNATLTSGYLDTFTQSQVVDKIANSSQEDDLYNSGFFPLQSAHTKQMVLLKDNREALSFNINFSFITDSDRNIVSNKIWKMGDIGNSNIKLMLFTSQELSKQKSTIDKINYIETTLTFDTITYSNDYDMLYLDIESALSGFTDEELDNVKSMAFCYTNLTSSFTYFLGRNVSGLTATQKRGNWYIAMAMVKQD